MKFWITLMVFIQILNSSAFAKAQRAIILSGNTINTGLFLGMIEGSVQGGKPVDLTIGTCGGSIAAAIANLVPKPEERIELVKSEKFYNLLKALEMNDITWTAFGGKIYELYYHARDNTYGAQEKMVRRVPDLFTFFLLTMRDEFNHFLELDQPFLSTPRGLRTVILGSRLEFQPEEAGKIINLDRKLFTEVFFTDSFTASELSRTESFAGTRSVQSALNEHTEVISNLSLLQATRASIADPILMEPAKIGNSYFTTGATNIDPFNVAADLADEVITHMPGDFDSISVPILQSTYGFDVNLMKRLVRLDMEYFKRKKYILKIHDVTFPKMKPGPTRNLWGAISEMNPKRIVKFTMGVPPSYEAYRALVEQQYQFGIEITKNAVLER